MYIMMSSNGIPQLRKIGFPSSMEAMATPCVAVLALPILLAAMTEPLVAATSRKPEMTNSLPMNRMHSTGERSCSQVSIINAAQNSSFTLVLLPEAPQLYTTAGLTLADMRNQAASEEPRR